MLTRTRPEAGGGNSLGPDCPYFIARLSIHHLRYTVNNAAPGKERKAEMRDPKPPAQRGEQEHQRRGSAPRQRRARLSTPYRPNVRDKQVQEEWYERTLYQILLFAGGIALFGLVLGLVLDWYINPQTSAQKKDLVQALGLITAGVAGAVGIFFTWRGQRITREAQEQNQKNTLEQLKQARDELEAARRGQITERFTRAIDQLGAMEGDDRRVETRLGGIHALEQIGKEAEEYYWPVIEILAAYVRHRTPRTPETDADAHDETRTTHREPDVQAALSVIGRRTRRHESEAARIDLEGTDLRNAEFSDANCTGIWFWRADLRGANFERADLRLASLDDANLSNAEFSDAKLDEARLHNANLADVFNLKQEQINQAEGNRETELPDGLVTPESWTIED